MLSLGGSLSLSGRGPGSSGSGQAARCRMPADTAPAAASFARKHGTWAAGWQLSSSLCRRP
jgi:hypothetical protein